MYLLLAVIHGEESSVVHVQGCERRTLSSACPELQGFGETGGSAGNVSLQTCVCVLNTDSFIIHCPWLFPFYCDVLQLLP